MHKVSSAQDYRDLKKKANECLGLVVHFSAGWCEPCKAVNEFLTKQSKVYKDKVLFADVDCEAHGDICAEEGVESVPFIVFFRTTRSDKQQERVADVAGAKLDQLTMNLISLYGDKGGDGTQRKDFPSLDEYLTYLFSRKGIVMFITGTPSRPRCGFTGRLCEMMGEIGAPYVFYDVMADDEACERLKTLSNWPTYPQVYVNGDLIGGWDICREMNETGELREALGLGA